MRKMKSVRVLAFLLVAFLISALAAVAAAPNNLTITFQMYNSSNGVALNGTHTVTMHAYSVPSGGSAVMNESARVDFLNGVGHVLLAANVSLLGVDSQRWWTSQVAGGTETSPRIPDTAVRQAFWANNASRASSVSYADIVGFNFTRTGNVTGNSTFANQARNATYSAGVTCSDIQGATSNLCTIADTNTGTGIAVAVIGSDTGNSTAPSNFSAYNFTGNNGNLTTSTSGSLLIINLKNILNGLVNIITSRIEVVTGHFTNVNATNMTVVNVSAVNTFINNTITFVATTTPATPAANRLLLYAEATQGHTRPVILDDDGIEFVLNRDSVFVARNTQAATITKGQAVRINGSTGNVPNIALAQANSSVTLPAVGVAVQDITTGSFGNIMILGVLTMFDTSAFSVSDRIFVSETAAGALTNVRPAYPNLSQRMGSVLVSGVGNGAIYVTTAPFIGGEDSGTIAANFYAANLVGNVSGNVSGNINLPNTATNDTILFGNVSQLRGNLTNLPNTATNDSALFANVSQLRGNVTQAGINITGNSTRASNSTYTAGVNCADIVGTADNVCVDADTGGAQNVTGNSTFANLARNATYSAGMNCADISGTADNLCVDADTGGNPNQFERALTGFGGTQGSNFTAPTNDSFFNITVTNGNVSVKGNVIIINATDMNSAADGANQFENAITNVGSDNGNFTAPTNATAINLTAAGGNLTVTNTGGVFSFLFKSIIGGFAKIFADRIEATSLHATSANFTNATLTNITATLIMATNVSGELPYPNLYAYPAGCSAGQFISALGDSPTCGTPTQYNDAALTANDTTLFANASQLRNNITNIYSVGNLTGKAAGGDLTGTYPNPTITSNAVALTDDTTGNYVATVAATSPLSVAGADAEGATKTLSLRTDVNMTFANVTINGTGGGGTIFWNGSGICIGAC